MDAYPADAANLTYFEHPPILLAASSERALARAEPAIRASGLRVGARLLLEHASERIERQASYARTRMTAAACSLSSPLRQARPCGAILPRSATLR
jgi:hypothetical protein